MLELIFTVKAYRAAKNLHAEELLENLKKTYSFAFKINDSLKGCKYFTLLDPEQSTKLFESEEYIYQDLPYDINHILMFILKTTTDSYKKLVSGIADAFGSENELTLALTVRSFIEHISQIDDIHNEINKKYDLLKKHITLSQNSGITDGYDRDGGLKDLLFDLFRFSSGSVVQLDCEFPKISSSNKAWVKFNKRLHETPDHFKPKYRVMKYIDLCASRNKFPILRTIYDILCEFCHPNSLSRNFHFHKENFKTAIEYSFYNDKYPPGMNMLVNLCKIVIPFLCDIAERSLKTIESLRLPIPGNKYQKEAFPGSIPIRDQYGNEGWVSTSSVTFGKRVYELTDEMKNQLSQMYSRVWDVCGVTKREYVEQFRSDTHPEIEIEIVQNVIKFYEKEVSSRKIRNKSEKEILYWLLIVASMGMKDDEIENAYPHQRKPKNFKAILERFRNSFE